MIIISYKSHAGPVRSLKLDSIERLVALESAFKLNENDSCAFILSNTRHWAMSPSEMEKVVTRMRVNLGGDHCTLGNRSLEEGANLLLSEKTILETTKGQPLDRYGRYVKEEE